jgi:hypothetical protein
MEIEVVHGVGFHLHTSPEETLKCRFSRAHGPREPSPARSTPSEPGVQPTICARSRRRSTRSSPAPMPQP